MGGIKQQQQINIKDQIIKCFIGYVFFILALIKMKVPMLINKLGLFSPPLTLYFIFIIYVYIFMYG